MGDPQDPPGSAETGWQERGSEDEMPPGHLIRPASARSRQAPLLWPGQGVWEETGVGMRMRLGQPPIHPPEALLLRGSGQGTLLSPEASVHTPGQRRSAEAQGGPGPCHRARLLPTDSAPGSSLASG